MRIYHIVDGQAWHQARTAEVYAPPELARDGFLHCCRESQIGFVARRHFAGRSDLLVLCIDPGATGAALRWERTEPDEDTFPHLHGPLPVQAVLSARRLEDWL